MIEVARKRGLLLLLASSLVFKDYIRIDENIMTSQSMTNEDILGDLIEKENKDGDLKKRVAEVKIFSVSFNIIYL